MGIGRAVWLCDVSQGPCNANSAGECAIYRFLNAFAARLPQCASLATNPPVSDSTRDYDYPLPPELIASRPLEHRAASRMLVVDRTQGTLHHRQFSDLPEYLQPDDLWVLNDTKVIPARVFSDDGRVELLCLDRLSPLEWRCLVRPGKRMKLGREITVDGIRGVVTEVFENGDRLLRWDAPVDLDRCGHLALPHYMGREDDLADRSRYQTVFAKQAGAIAAPTAGLHFTPELLNQLHHAFLTLHVGVGTFRPVSVADLRDHVMHSERYVLDRSTAQQINQAKRVVAVGTTVTRVLEALARNHPSAGGQSSGHPSSDPANPSGLESSDVVHSRIAAIDHRGETDIFIRPPYRFRAVDALLTNFHLPQSTLIMLVSAFAGRELTLQAYQEAVAQRYRFFSYGDCMLII